MPALSDSLRTQLEKSVIAARDAAEAGKEYEHGGIRPQECVLPVLHVRRV